MFFHNLNDITYQKIDLYLKKIDNEKVKKITLNITDEEQKQIEITQSNLNDNYNQQNSRLSSLEKNIIKKKDYYEKLKEESNIDTDIIYKSDDDEMDIFLNKDITIDSPKEINKKKSITKIVSKNVTKKNTSSK